MSIEVSSTSGFSPTQFEEVNVQCSTMEIEASPIVHNFIQQIDKWTTHYGIEHGILGRGTRGE